MELIRKKSKLTRMLILRELVMCEPKDQKSISESIGITPQAVSEYLKKMDEEGLVDTRSRPLRATVMGVDYLQHHLLQLKDFIDRSINGLEIVRSTDAIAASRIEKGEELRLFIRNGLLHCEPGNDAPSTGIADNDGEKGDIVMISGLSGVVEIPKTALSVVEIEPARKGGGSTRIDTIVIERLKEKCRIEGESRIAVLDQEAASLMIRSGLDYDLELPGAPTIAGTLERGVSILCFGTPHSTSRIFTSQELSSDRYEKCLVKLLEVT
jgi:putative transcriptional regulator